MRKERRDKGKTGGEERWDKGKTGGEGENKRRKKRVGQKRVERTWEEGQEVKAQSPDRVRASFAAFEVDS